MPDPRELHRIPETSLMRAIRELTKIDGVVKFAEQPDLMGSDDPMERHLEMRIRRPYNGTTQNYSAIVFHELDVIRHIKKFMHEVT